jgi:hypothetical protein
VNAVIAYAVQGTPGPRGPEDANQAHDPEGAQPGKGDDREARTASARGDLDLPAISTQSPRTSKLAHPVITTIDSCRNLTAEHAKGTVP